MAGKEKMEVKTETHPEIRTDTNDNNELFTKLRTSISSSRDSYKISLAQTKEVIAQREEELKLLKIRQHKLEGAIEASEGFLVAVLPNNNKPLLKD